MLPPHLGLRVGLAIAAACVLLAVGLGLREGARSVDETETLLLTGFGPFGEYAVNPSWEAARRLEGWRVGRTRVRTTRLDVSYDRAADQLREAIRRVRPTRVLCLGVAPTARLLIETLARNRDETPVADNQGVVREGTPIVLDGPALLPTGLPVRTLLDRLQAEGFEAATSEDAGGYLCNHVFYVLRHELPDRAVTGFVHVPPESEAWPLDRIEAAVRTLVAGIDEVR